MTSDKGKPFARSLVPELRRIAGRLVLLAFAGDEAVRLAVCFPGFSRFRAKPLLSVHDLAAQLGYRNKGVGRALLNAVETAVRRRDCAQLTLEVRIDKEIALGLYRKQGFEAGPTSSGEIQHLFLEKRL